MAAYAELGTDIRLSERASIVAQRFLDEGWFSTRKDAAMFAAAYVLKYHFRDFDPGAYTVKDQFGSNYGYYALDEGGYWETLMKHLFQTDTPKLYFRNLMIFGLEMIGDDIDRLGILQIVNYI